MPLSHPAEENTDLPVHRMIKNDTRAAKIGWYVSPPSRVKCLRTALLQVFKIRALCGVVHLQSDVAKKMNEASKLISIGELHSPLCSATGQELKNDA